MPNWLPTRSEISHSWPIPGQATGSTATSPLGLSVSEAKTTVRGRYVAVEETNDGSAIITTMFWPLPAAVGGTAICKKRY